MKQRILVIEDAGPAQQALTNKLVERGFVVLTAQNEKEFWSHAITSETELVVFEVCLQNRLGSDVYRALLELQRGQKIPVIFKNGLTEEEKPVAALHDENYVFFPEPVSFDCLYTEIQKLFGKQPVRAA